MRQKPGCWICAIVSQNKNKIMKFDWDTLKQEFICGSESLNAFRIRKGINRDWAYKKAKENDWEGSRQRLKESASRQIEKKYEKDLVSTWGHFLEPLEEIREKVSLLIQRETNTPKDFKDLAGALDILVKNLRLLKGESTQNISKRVNVHQLISQEIRKENSNGRAYTREDIERYSAGE